MGSRIVKYQICDSCGHESPADAVASVPPGWGRLLVSHGSQGKAKAGKTLDLCPECVTEIQTKCRDRERDAA